MPRQRYALGIETHNGGIREALPLFQKERHLAILRGHRQNGGIIVAPRRTQDLTPTAAYSTSQVAFVLEHLRHDWGNGGEESLDLDSNVLS